MLVSFFFIHEDLRLGSTHLNLLIAGGELPLLKDEDVVSDPLQQQGDQLIILLPTQLQLLKHRQSVQVDFDYVKYQGGHFNSYLEES